MTTEAKLSLSSDTVLVKLYGGVTGVTRKAEDKGTTHDGKAVETKNLVTTRQADSLEAERAKKLLNKLRATVDSYCSTIINLSVTSAGQLADLRAEVQPIQAQIDTHNASARYHKVDRALICVPISLKADPAAITEVCRQIGEELKVAVGFFTCGEAPVPGAPAPLPGGHTSLKDWLSPINNWLTRTKNLGQLFPTITGEMITQAVESVRTLKGQVSEYARAAEKLGQAPESALRTALGNVVSVPGALGLLENAIGFTAITDQDAKAANDEARDDGASVEIH